MMMNITEQHLAAMINRGQGGGGEGGLLKEISALPVDHGCLVCRDSTDEYDCLVHSDFTGKVSYGPRLRFDMYRSFDGNSYYRGSEYISPNIWFEVRHNNKPLFAVHRESGACPYYVTYQDYWNYVPCPVFKHIEYRNVQLQNRNLTAAITDAKRGDISISFTYTIGYTQVEYSPDGDVVSSSTQQRNFGTSIIVNTEFYNGVASDLSYSELFDHMMRMHEIAINS